MRIDTFLNKGHAVLRGWIKVFDQEDLVLRQVFTNKDDSTGLMNLVCSDLRHLTLNGGQVALNRQHKMSRYKAITFFMSMFSVFKLKNLKLKIKFNQFALHSKIFITAAKQAYVELRSLCSAAV